MVPDAVTNGTAATREKAMAKFRDAWIDGVTRLVGEAIERALGYHIASAQLADARARIG
jgi:hypothetical protein